FSALVRYEETHISVADNERSTTNAYERKLLQSQSTAARPMLIFHFIKLSSSFSFGKKNECAISA
ncbi:unnamed protein product, partial [Ceratitis capitata]